MPWIGPVISAARQDRLDGSGHNLDAWFKTTAQSNRSDHSTCCSLSSAFRQVSVYELGDSCVDHCVGSVDGAWSSGREITLSEIEPTAPELVCGASCAAASPRQSNMCRLAEDNETGIVMQPCNAGRAYEDQEDVVVHDGDVAGLWHEGSVLPTPMNGSDDAEVAPMGDRLQLVDAIFSSEVLFEPPHAAPPLHTRRLRSVAQSIKRIRERERVQAMQTVQAVDLPPLPLNEFAHLPPRRRRIQFDDLLPMGGHWYDSGDALTDPGSSAPTVDSSQSSQLTWVSGFYDSGEHSAGSAARFALQRRRAS